MSTWKKRFTVAAGAVLLLLLFLLTGKVHSVSCEDSCNDKQGDERRQCLDEVTKACEAKLAETAEKKQTLKSTIDHLNTQITYTQSQISQTAYEIEQLEKEIVRLTGKISILNDSLEDVTQLLVKRIVATYKQSRYTPLQLFFSSRGFADFVSRYRYLKLIQSNDRKVMYELEEARIDFDNQKADKEEKQEQVLGLQTKLVGQKKALADQQGAKSRLLEETKNDEKRYQNLLARARAEYEAIQNVLAGGGTETEVRDVREGETIASIIPTASCNSDGPHLHFTVVKGDSVQNPLNFLKGVDHENCSGSSCGSSDGDSFNPGGDWNWPIDARVRLNQGYGETWAVRNTWVGGIYRFHSGIDIFNESRTVKAVKEGKLFRGSYVGSGGCTLRYVKVDHKDSDIDSYYLHVNFI